ncbi:TonB-dependent heme receptor A like [Melia azedarach]|uniref:TonB-dependent heme receptor A like n=1 Tax=Melia azedarach TaxID=155640 RepID=A0ACC1WQH0_MELAZ|nr:TonB-dependent heme receptor A like [Melia azedarach]
MALNNGVRSVSKLLTSSETLVPKSVKRVFHSTGVKRMGGGHGHAHDEPYYLHAKHMYNLDRMKHQKLKMPLAVFTAFSIGVAVPVYAVIFQQRKTASA